MISIAEKSLLAAVVVYGLACLLVGCAQRRFLYFPSHEASSKYAQASGLTPWNVDGNQIGFCRLSAQPRRVWLMFHGNGGQAAQRGYVLPLLGPEDGFFVLEYPGYGDRSGKPSKQSFNQAAEFAYRTLRSAYPDSRICVLGESIGSGPACYVSGLDPAPDRIVLVVPFARLSDLAQEKISWLPTKALLLDRWDNIEAIASYTGPIDIYGAKRDEIIPIHHARALAESKPGSIFHVIDGGHNDWPYTRQVDLGSL